MEDIYASDYVKRLFDSMAGSYERMNYITSFGFSIRWRKQFIRALGDSSADIQVIDLLSGLGENWTMLTNQFPNARFTALDFSARMCQISQQKYGNRPGITFRILHQDVLQNNLSANQYDVITCAYGLKTFNKEQLSKLAGEVCRILKPGGRFTFIEVSKPRNKLLLFFYRLYLKHTIPILGKLFLGNPDDYRMLWTYTEKFGDASAVQEIFQRYPLDVRFDSYFFGCATGISGIKRH
ncbi:class I SAM-dependent methyltransferase [Arsenicibacter rosenii]|uniref:Ubiquinone biosynthesis protein n=1 Tax=Arsenicibacter rosenii TaxID=1750698 RepID=A0A1S2VPR6_9BACT|nr:class I SAM-dependent methyltransferase [Arsenicibacter rosenii]OIN60761.1 ubiquinone biosynthesis protein [Arsenicibacter rosenii]